MKHTASTPDGQDQSLEALGSQAKPNIRSREAAGFLGQVRAFVLKQFPMTIYSLPKNLGPDFEAIVLDYRILQYCLSCPGWFSFCSKVPETCVCTEATAGCSPWQDRRKSPLPLFKRVSMAPNSSVVGVEGGAGVLAASQLEAGEGAKSNLGSYQGLG